MLRQELEGNNMALIQPLSSKPLAITGDVHGERSMLRDLLKKLGVDPSFDKSSTDVPSLDRHLVFVGDLVDRGEDSPGVVKDVLKLMDAGLASCVLGNHEYNLLCDNKKERSGTAWQRDVAEERKGWTQAVLTEADRAEFDNALDEFPLILERSDVRIVHAAWHEESVAKIRNEAADHTIKSYSDEMIRKLAPTLAKLEKQVEKELPEMEVLSKDGDKPLREPKDVSSYIRKSLMEQNDNPLKAITSGLEVEADKPKFTDGKWRHMDRA